MFEARLCDAGKGRGLDILERRHWSAILFLIGPSNALELTEKLRKQEGSAHGFAPSMPLLSYV